MQLSVALQAVVPAAAAPGSPPLASGRSKVEVVAELRSCFCQHQRQRVECMPLGRQRPGEAQALAGGALSFSLRAAGGRHSAGQPSGHLRLHQCWLACVPSRV